MPFDRILDEVREGRAEAGLVIHEGQLTYGGQGLVKVLDLGAWWKQETGLPLPLGGNAVRRDLGRELMQRLTRLVRETVEHSLAHRAAGARVRDELRARHGPGRRRPLRRDVGQRHDGRDGGARPARGAALPGPRLPAGVIPRQVAVDFVEA